MSVINQSVARLTIRDLAKYKNNKVGSMLTAYDIVTANCLDRAGIDILLVGDSVGNVLYGFENTHQVSLEMIIAHTKAVVNGSSRSFVVADMPFGSFQVSKQQTTENAIKLIEQGGAQAVKLEGASEFIIDQVKHLVAVGIPVMGHIGLTPQYVHQMGGYYKHGKNEQSKALLKKQAQELSDAGCFSVVLECVEERLAKNITNSIAPITIGIGSGSVCDFEVLVINDLVGMVPNSSPKFATQFFDFKNMIVEAGEKFIQQIKNNRKKVDVNENQPSC